MKTKVKNELVGISKHYYHGVSSEEHLADVPVSVDGPALLLPLALDGVLCPHLLHILQDHVTMTIEGLDTP